MAKKKDKQRSTKHTHKNKDRVTRTPLNPGVNSGDPDGKQFLLHYWIPSCKSSYKPVALFTKVCIVLFFSLTIILRQFPSHFHKDCRMKNFNRKANFFVHLRLLLSAKDSIAT